MNKHCFVALSFTLLGCLAFISAANGQTTGGYWIKVDATVTGPFTVHGNIQTNIPGSIALAAELALTGQKAHDTFIGTDFVKVPVVNGRGEFSIDGTKGILPHGSRLPAGKYEVVVSFHPRWRENSSTAKKVGIKDSIENKTIVQLSASGSSVESAKAKAESQKWVILNVSSGTTWEERFWKKKFGPWQEVDYKGDGNPDILKMYYFKSIDMTLMVNILKGEIVTYRKGMASK